MLTGLIATLLYVVIAVCLYTVATSAAFGGAEQDREVLGGLVK